MFAACVLSPVDDGEDPDGLRPRVAAAWNGC